MNKNSRGRLTGKGIFGGGKSMGEGVLVTAPEHMSSAATSCPHQN